MQNDFSPDQGIQNPLISPNGRNAATVIPAQAGIQEADSPAPPPADLPERTPYRGRPTGRRLLPDEAAQEVCDRYHYDGVSQACLGRLLAEWGYPMGLSSLRNMLAGRTYPHLRRPAWPAAAGDQP